MPDSIQVTVDQKAFAAEMTVFRKQIPYATAKAINYTAMDAQTAVRDHMKEAFTIRRQAFAKAAVKIKPFANKQNLSATLAIDPPGGANRDVFSQHELGGDKKPVRGQYLAVPIEGVIRKNVQQVIPTSKRPRNLTKSFKLKSRSGKLFIMIRKGSGKNADMLPAYELVRSVHLKPRLAFHDTATKTITARWNARWNQAWLEAMNTALR